MDDPLRDDRGREGVVVVHPEPRALHAQEDRGRRNAKRLAARATVHLVEDGPAEQAQASVGSRRGGEQDLRSGRYAHPDVLVQHQVQLTVRPGADAIARTHDRVGCVDDLLPVGIQPGHSAPGAARRRLLLDAPVDASNADPGGDERRLRIDLGRHRGLAPADRSLVTPEE